MRVYVSCISWNPFLSFSPSSDFWKFTNLHVVWGTAYIVIVSHLIFHTVQKMDAVLMLQDM